MEVEACNYNPTMQSPFRNRRRACDGIRSLLPTLLSRPNFTEAVTATDGIRHQYEIRRSVSQPWPALSRLATEVTEVVDCVIGSVVRYSPPRRPRDLAAATRSRGGVVRLNGFSSASLGFDTQNSSDLLDEAADARRSGTALQHEVPIQEGEPVSLEIPHVSTRLCCVDEGNGRCVLDGVVEFGQEHRVSRCGQRT